MRLRIAIAIPGVGLIAAAIAVGVFSAQELFCNSMRTRMDWIVTRVVTDQLENEIIWNDRHALRCASRFTIRPTDTPFSNGIRAELEARERAHPGDGFSYRFSTRFSESSLRLPSGVVTQWHERVPEGHPHKRPPLAHRLRQGALVVSLWNDEIFASAGIDGDGLEIARLPYLKANRWYDFFYFVKWDHRAGGEGRVRAWIRECGDAPECHESWKPWIDHAGPIGFQEALQYYIKFGAYTTRPFTEATRVDHLFRPSWIRPVSTEDQAKLKNPGN